MASRKRAGIEIGVERYSPIVPESFGKALSNAGRFFSLGKDRYHLGMTIDLRDPIGVLWLDKPSKKVGERPIRGVLSPARFVLSSSSGTGGSRTGPETEVRFVMGRPIDLFQYGDGEAPDSIDFDRWDYLSIEFTARHVVDLVPKVKGIKKTTYPWGRIRAEAMSLAGVDGIEIVKKAGDVPKQKPIQYRALIGSERNRVDHNWERPPMTDALLREIGERFVALGGLEAQGKRNQVAPIRAQLEFEFDQTPGNINQILNQVRKRGLVKGLEPMSNPTKKKGKR